MKIRYDALYAMIIVFSCRHCRYFQPHFGFFTFRFAFTALAALRFSEVSMPLYYVTTMPPLLPPQTYHFMRFIIHATTLRYYALLILRLRYLFIASLRHCLMVYNEGRHAIITLPQMPLPFSHIMSLRFIRQLSFDAAEY